MPRIANANKLGIKLGFTKTGSNDFSFIYSKLYANVPQGCDCNNISLLLNMITEALILCSVLTVGMSYSFLALNNKKWNFIIRVEFKSVMPAWWNNVTDHL